MITDSDLIIHIDLKTIAEKIADAAGSKETMKYDPEVNNYYVTGVTEDMLKTIGFELLAYDNFKTPVYKYYDILVSLKDSQADVYKYWRESYLDYPNKVEGEV